MIRVLLVASDGLSDRRVVGRRDVHGSGPSIGWVGSRNLDPCAVVNIF